MANFSTRLSKLEIKYVTPMPVHIIFKAYSQPEREAFDIYQAKRSAEGYTPKEGWEQLRTEFLSCDGKGQVKFITFSVDESVAPHPPIVTNAKED